MFRVGPSQDVASVFKDGVLKSTAGPEKRPALLSRKTNGPERTVHAAIRTGGHAPEPIETGDARHVTDFFGWNPFVIDGNAETLCA
jgi:hypothetical protein